MSVSERLVAVRKKHGYTRARLSDETGIPYGTITKYETGEREPGHSFIIEIASKFGVSTDYLLGLEDDPSETKTPPSRIEPSQGEDEAMRAFAQMLVSAGLIEEGFQLTDRDTEFLGNALRSIDMWIEERKKNQK